MCRSRMPLVLPLVLLLLAVFAAGSAVAVEGPFVGVDLGVSEPTNDNYRSHVATGGSGSPFVGYMFNDYLGLQADLQATFQSNDESGRCRPPACSLAGNSYSQWTTVLGGLLGPRINIPLGDKVDLYGIGQAAAFKGLGGSLNQWAPGFQVGGGIDFHLTREVAVGLYGRWNRAYMAPGPPLPGFNESSHAANDHGPKDARWATAGVGLTFYFPPAEAAPPPPPPPPPAPPVAQAPPPVKKKIVLRSVHFDFNKATIRPDARPVLDEAVQILKGEAASADIRVEGHTDSVGKDAYNMKLSQRRANAVREYLVSHGISASRVRTEGFGKRKPVASNDTADGRAQNRRVELHID